MRAVTKRRRFTSCRPAAGRHLALDAVRGRENAWEVGLMLYH
jgi:hypothetical protein